DPAKYDEAGIDPHMIVSTNPRTGLPGASSPDDADPVHGREWTTNGTDLQFACTFDLYEIGADGKSVPAPHLCDPAKDTACDCGAADEGEGSRLFPVCEVPQIKGDTCRDEDRKPGFCYGENVPGTKCAQSLLFSKATAKLIGARFTLQCIQVDDRP